MAIQNFQDEVVDVMPTHSGTAASRFANTSVPTRRQMSTFSPKVDTYETEKCYHIEAALPGVRAEDIHVSYEQGRLTIAGERKFRTERKERQYYLVESAYGAFQRTFQLPHAEDPNKIEAEFKSGVLHVRVPKGSHKPMHHEIPVRSLHKGR